MIPLTHLDPTRPMMIVVIPAEMADLPYPQALWACQPAQASFGNGWRLQNTDYEALSATESSPVSSAGNIQISDSAIL